MIDMISVNRMIERKSYYDKRRLNQTNLTMSHSHNRRHRQCPSPPYRDRYDRDYDDDGYHSHGSYHGVKYRSRRSSDNHPPSKPHRKGSYRDDGGYSGRYRQPNPENNYRDRTDATLESSDRNMNNGSDHLQTIGSLGDQALTNNIIDLDGSSQQPITLQQASGSGNTEWIIRFTNGGIMYSVTVTSFSGEPYHLVQFNGPLVINGVPHVTSTAAMALAKQTSTGELVFSKTLWTYDGLRQDQQYSQIVIDGGGNTYILTRFTGEIILSDGPVLNSENGSILIVKTDMTGKILWNIQLLGAIQQTNQIDVDPNGNVYVVGSFNGSVRIGPIGSIFVSSNLSQSAFVVKMDTNGVAKWVIAGTGTGLISGCGASYDSTTDQIVGTGSFTDEVTFGNFTLRNELARFNSFVVIINSSGMATSLIGVVHDITPPQNVELLDIIIPSEQYLTLQRVDVNSSGEIFVTGEFAGRFTFGGSTVSSKIPGIVIAKWSRGIWEWAAQIRIVDNPDTTFVSNITADSSGNAYVAFHTIGGVQLLNSLGNPVMIQNGSGSVDLTIVKIGGNSQWIWINKFCGTVENISNQIVAQDTSLYVVGNNCISETRVDGFIAKVRQ